MKAAIFKGKDTIEVGTRPEPRIEDPTDAVVRVVRGCVCGSDLWYYRGINAHKVGSIGHEYIGVIETVGPQVRDLAVGDFVIAPFTYSDGTCPACQAGYQSNCLHGGAFGNGDTDGGQGEKVRSPFADATLVKAASPTLSWPRSPPCRTWRAPDTTQPSAPASRPATRSLSSVTAPSGCPPSWAPGSSAPPASSP